MNKCENEGMQHTNLRWSSTAFYKEWAQIWGLQLEISWPVSFAGDPHMYKCSTIVQNSQHIAIAIATCCKFASNTGLGLEYPKD